MRYRRLWLAIIGAMAALAALVDVDLVGPRINVRWRQGVDAAERAAAEQRFSLLDGNRIEETSTGWTYELGDRSFANVEALVRDPAVEDTANIDRETYAVARPHVEVSFRPLLSAGWIRERYQSLWLFAIGGALLWAARASAEHRRRTAAMVLLIAFGTVAWLCPLSVTDIHMGDAQQHVQSRAYFNDYAGVHDVRFEAHLSYVILAQLDRLFGGDLDAAVRAQRMFANMTTMWFVLCALAIGGLERWSPMVLRYLGLVVLAPAALLYFGWLETGYHSLNAAAFPLLARGLSNGTWRLEAGSALTGLGAALHGFGLVSLIGAWLAALAARVRATLRVAYVLRIAAWGTAAYLGWAAIYVIVLKLPITVGTAQSFPWRHLFESPVQEDRVNAAIFSAVGGRDVSMTAWVVGALLLVVAATLWRRHRDEVQTAMAYSLPSIFFTVFIWPTQGLGQGMHLVFARFAALYALAWVCAHDVRRTYIAAAVLVTGHWAFWEICLNLKYQNPLLP